MDSASHSGGTVLMDSDSHSTAVIGEWDAELISSTSNCIAALNHRSGLGGELMDGPPGEKDRVLKQCFALLEQEEGKNPVPPVPPVPKVLALTMGEWKCLKLKVGPRPRA